MTLLAACSVGFWFWLGFSISWCWISFFCCHCQGEDGLFWGRQLKSTLTTGLLCCWGNGVLLPLVTCVQLGEMLAIWKRRFEQSLWDHCGEKMMKGRCRAICWRVHRWFFYWFLCKWRVTKFLLIMTRSLQVWRQNVLLLETRLLRTRILAEHREASQKEPDKAELWHKQMPTDKRRSAHKSGTLGCLQLYGGQDPDAWRPTHP